MQPVNTPLPPPVTHYENFPVASWLCPPHLRAPIAAIYAFARTADDIADEGPANAAQRGWPTWLPTGPTCTPSQRGKRPRSAGPPSLPRWPPCCKATPCPYRCWTTCSAPSSRTWKKPVMAPATTTAPSCWTTAAARPTPWAGCCCTCTACRARRRWTRSDAICTALQLINFWQDLSVDLPRARFYLPDEQMRRPRCGPRPDLLALRPTAQTTALIQELSGWTRATMLRGAPLVHRVARAHGLGAAPGGARGHCAFWTKCGPCTMQPGAAGPSWSRPTSPFCCGAPGACLPRAAASPPPHDAPRICAADKAAASGSSFYYAFLFLPAPRRAAITAFYAFCREVDDVVDEVQDPGVAATKLAWWQAEVAGLRRPAQPPGDAGADAAGG
jgi:phytoene/squalene synthetase